MSAANLILTPVQAQTIVQMMHSAKSINAEVTIVLNHQDRYVSVCLADNMAQDGIEVADVGEDGSLERIVAFNTVQEFAAFFGA